MDAQLELEETGPIADQRSVSRRAGRNVHRSSWFKRLVECVLAAALAFASYYFISHYFVQSVQVVGSSMVPTLHDSEHYLLNRWIYHFRTPQRRDVVVI